MTSARATATLEEDRETLLEIKNTLAGTASLNWSTKLPVEQWKGVIVENYRVTGLGCRSLNLSGRIPAELGNLAKLRTLYLNNNELVGSIPDELGNLFNLEQLSLRGNELTGKIPASLGSLSRLQELRLGNNNLTGSIPVEFGNLVNLEVLSLRYNQLTGTIPSTLGNLSNLRELYIGSNQLTGNVPDKLRGLPNLKKVSSRNYNKLAVNKNKQTRRRIIERNHNQKEHSEKWESKDATATEFYAYILKLDGGKFYAGHTREIRERMMEHRDGQTKSTAGKNPKLVWFTTVSTRDLAKTIEAELKQLCEKNPREVRRRVRHFQDLVEELDFR